MGHRLELAADVRGERPLLLRVPIRVALFASLVYATAVSFA
jgi:hypothetical protein